jgi:hypothetical protein
MANCDLEVPAFGLTALNAEYRYRRLLLSSYGCTYIHTNKGRMDYMSAYSVHNADSPKQILTIYISPAHCRLRF